MLTFAHERIQVARQFNKNQEKQVQIEKEEAEICKLEMESQKRKRILQELDMIRDEKFGKNYDPFAVEKAKKESKLLNRAFLAKQEQEDEVKRANKIILAAKVHILQDAQINEKKELEKMWREKELNLEKIMLEEDAKKLAEQKRKEQEWKELRDKYANELKEGLKSRELKKLIQAERIENEAHAIAISQKILKFEEDSKKIAERERKNQIRKEFQDNIRACEEFKKKAEEQKREAEMKAQEYMRQKSERERKLDKERKIQRERKQMEIDRILSRQKEVLETKHEIEMANLRRIQEQKEREYRKKALETAFKRKKIESQVLEARAAQIEETKRIKARREELEAHDVLQLLNKLKHEEEEERAHKLKMHHLKEKYRIEIITQIQQKMENRRTFQIQSHQANEEQKKIEDTRQENIRKVITKKVMEMRESKIPEHIIRDVERQLKLCHI
ncbi:trichohyalin-like isoform X2 [Contarinia nasturtii]|uniref:trichohyalin-like isoform X2 n=1 Tax=Contarinia nasturtii TaxID=265458 RepID=UPI0012D4228B|nr:trichohyalin-like isoform X2 [Contarinia nasturtii]